MSPTDELQRLYEAHAEALFRFLEISPNTVASRYRYGIDKLRQCLRPYYEACAGELNSEKRAP